MRVVARAPRRQPDQLQQLAHARLDRRRAAGRVQPDRPRRSGRPTRCTGLSVCSAPWKTIATSVQRTARRRPGFIVSTSSPSSSTSPVTLVPARQQAQQRAGERRLPAAGLAGEAQRLAHLELEVRRRARPGTGRRCRQIGHVQVADRQQRAAASARQLIARWSRSRGSRISSSACPHEREREHHEHDPDARRHVVPPGLAASARPPRSAPRASCPTRRRADRRARGTTASSPTGSPSAPSAWCWRGSAATRWEDVAGHQVPVGGAERAASIHVVALLAASAPARGSAARSTATT